MTKNMNQIKTMITSFTLKKNELSGQMNHLTAEITQKNQSVSKFELYCEDYKKKINNQTIHTIATYVNHQRFLDRIVDTLNAEKENLRSLEEKKQELIAQYHGYTQKLDGLDECLDSIKQELQSQRDKLEDEERNELGTTRAAINKLLEENQ